MRKKDCINTLNDILHLLLEHECFESLHQELNISEEELEIILNSTIIDVDNDEY